MTPLFNTPKRRVNDRIVLQCYVEGFVPQKLSREQLVQERGSVAPHDTPPYPFMPSPTFAHSSRQSEFRKRFRGTGQPGHR